MGKNNPDISSGYIFYQSFLIWNTVLAGGFVIACCVLKGPDQVRLAEILTVVYAIIMIAVYIGIGLQIYQDGPTSLTGLSFFVTLGSFVFAAMIHPMEFTCIFCMPIYMATIPSMYMLLMIYAIFNINDV